ncbi:MAG: DAK2 domain-containing protein [Ruminococcaceae bacterium]|nr:DAK2 domain-containing protein [Oscillospiraceae bacterium]
MTINGKTFCMMIMSAANSLDNSKDVINNMNVFPVPDGDTGINMTLTMRTMKNIDGSESLSDCAKKAADIALRSARGNSGAILSLFFRGMSKAFKGLCEADSKDIATAFSKGYSEAYKAVMNPTRGTILTVMQNCAEKAVEFTKDGGYAGDVEGLFRALVEVSEIALAKTPEQLPKLKEANVVDAGGYGFVTILKGMLAVLENDPIFLINQADGESGEADFTSFNTEDITFSYCTEAVVQKSSEFVGENTAAVLHDFICGIGDSVVFVDDEEIIKLHVHTDHPGSVMEKALEFGSLITVKVENMREQHSALVVEKEKPSKRKIEKKYGFVSVCLGNGIAAAFRDIGVDSVVHGGQTMNPSTQDIIDAVNATPAKYVFVLPNNKNIYMVAEQASKIIKDKKVIVVPSTSVPEGISAMIAFNPDGEPDENLTNMESAIKGVTTISVTNAVRSTTVEGEKISDGQTLGLVNGKIESIANGELACLRGLLDRLSDASFIMVFCGQGVSEEDMGTVEQMIREAAPMSDVSVIMGEQPLYPYIISVE